MVEPFLDQNRARGQPGGVDAGDAQICVAVRVAVTVSVGDVLQHVMRRLWVPMAVQRHGALKAHVEAADDEHARHAQRAQALDLAKAQREAVRRRLDAPRHRRQRQDVGRQVGDAVPGVGDHGLGVEGPAADELCNRHAEVAEQADARDAHAGVVAVGRRQICVVVMVVMAKEAVAVAVAMLVVVFMLVIVIVVVLVACLADGAHDEGLGADAAAEDGAQMKHGAARMQCVGQRQEAIGRRRQRKGRRDGGGRAQRLQRAAMSMLKSWIS